MESPKLSGNDRGFSVSLGSNGLATQEKWRIEGEKRRASIHS